MLKKWKMYFIDFPYIYGIATILDPCFKTENITKLIGFYYQSLDRPYSDVHNYVGNSKKLLAEVYDYYSSIYITQVAIRLAVLLSRHVSLIIIS